MTEPTPVDVEQAMRLVRKHYVGDDNGPGGTDVHVRFEALSMAIAQAVAKAREEAVGSFVGEVKLAYEKGYIEGLRGEKQ
jgi:hypothetical protein